MKNPVHNNWKTLVKKGYDRVSAAYRADSLHPSDPVHTKYLEWVTDLSLRLYPGARVLDLGCGNGVPVASWLVDAGFLVTGVDISPVQIRRARRLVPGAQFTCADIAELDYEPASFTAIVALYSLIHIPVEEQPALLALMWKWLEPGGYLLATVGADAWTGVEENWMGVEGAAMYWSHTDDRTFQHWLKDAKFAILFTRFIPEGTGGHTLLLAQRPPKLQQSR